MFARGVRASPFPKLSVQTAVLYGFGDVRHINLLCTVQIGNGARHAQHLIIGTRRKSEFFKCGFEHRRRGRGGGAEFSGERCVHFGVAGDSRTRKPCLLYFACTVYARFNRCRRFLFCRFGKVIEIHGRDFNVNVQSVQQRTRHARKIALRRARRAGAFARGVPVKATGTRIHCAHKHHRTRVRKSCRDARNRDFAVLNRLAHNFHRRARKFGQFI